MKLHEKVDTAIFHHVCRNFDEHVVRAGGISHMFSSVSSADMRFAVFREAFFRHHSKHVTIIVTLQNIIPTYVFVSFFFVWLVSVVKREVVEGELYVLAMGHFDGPRARRCSVFEGSCCVASQKARLSACYGHLLFFTTHLPPPFERRNCVWVF